jgi:integrase
LEITDASAAKLTLPAGKTEAVFFDDKLKVYGVRVRASGSATFVFYYKAIGGDSRRMTIGRVGGVKEKEARITAHEYYVQRYARKGDPAKDHQAKREKSADTIKAALPVFLATKKQKLKPRTYAELERHLQVNAKSLHGWQIDQLTLRPVAKLLAKIADNNGLRASDAVRGDLITFFKWAISEGLSETNPVIGTKKKHAAEPRERTLSGDELREVWLACEDDQYGAIVKLLILTAQRRDEIGALRWTEVDLDGAAITLPKHRTKNKRQHVVPLSAPAVAILKKQPVRAERDLIFGLGDGAFSGWSAAKRRLDARILARTGKAPAPWTLHDLRRTARTGFGALGVPPHISEAVINHLPSKLIQTYDRNKYEAEKKRALNRWGRYVVALVKEKKSVARKRARA